VSFYNQNGAAAIHPTPVVGVLGVLRDVSQRVPMGFSQDGDVIILLGDTRAELSGSEWAWVAHGHLGGVPPQVDLARERLLGEVIAQAARVGHVRSAHDVSEGGLIQALVESCLRHGLGARIALPDGHAIGSMPFLYLFSESTARAVVAVAHGHERAFTALCDERGLPWTGLGVVDANARALEVRGQFTIRLDELREAWSGTLPRLFGAEPAGRVDAPEPASREPEPASGSAPEREPEPEAGPESESPAAGSAAQSG
jgi:phosphoribosylformylglycinamidine synthase